MEATTQTPVTTTETAVTATPATSEPVSPTTTSERPTTQRELSKWFADHESPDAATVPANGLKEAPAATAQEPLAQTPGAIPPDPAENTPGPRLAEHKRILENARTKAVAEYRERFGWAEQIPKEKFDRIMAVAERLNTDPVGHLRTLYQELAQHPVHGPQLRSQAGRMLANRPEVEPQPDVDIVNEHGQVTGKTFSAARLAERDAWTERRLLAKVEGITGPIQARHQQDQQKQIAAEREAATSAAVDRGFADVLDILEITDAKAPESAQLLATVERVWDQHPDWSHERAAREVWKLHIRPTLEGKALTQALDTQKRKAAGNTAQAASGATPMKLKPNATQKEIAAFMQAMDGAR